MKSNILITSSGAKVLLVKSFKQAAQRFGARVLTADLRAVCASSFFSDEHLTLLPLGHPEAESQLIESVDKHNIGLIVPTRDGELEFMATLARKLDPHQTQVLCCDAPSLENVQNKANYSDRLEALGYKAIPRTSPNAPNLKYPMFTRPIIGAAGVGAFKIESLADMPPKESFPNRLFHPFIDAKEYSIDVLMGLVPGQAIQCVVRERLEVSGGEAKVSVIVSDPQLEREALEIASELGLVGHNVMQAFKTDQGEIYHIETNPRFGGASNLSIQVGLDSPARLLAMHFGETGEAITSVREIAIGATMYRYSADFIEV